MMAPFMLFWHGIILIELLPIKIFYQMRKPKIQPSFDFHLLYDPDGEQVMVTILKGHLVIEAMLCQILLSQGYSENIWKWSFYQKTEKCKKISPLQDWQAEICSDINTIRNDYCHSLGHRISFDDAFNYIVKWSKLGLFFTDERIHSEKEDCANEYGIMGIISESISSIIDEIDAICVGLGMESTYCSQTER